MASIFTFSFFFPICSKPKMGAKVQLLRIYPQVPNLRFTKRHKQNWDLRCQICVWKDRKEPMAVTPICLSVFCQYNTISAMINLKRRNACFGSRFLRFWRCCCFLACDKVVRIEGTHSRTSCSHTVVKKQEQVDRASPQLQGCTPT